MLRPSPAPFRPAGLTDPWHAAAGRFYHVNLNCHEGAKTPVSCRIVGRDWRPLCPECLSLVTPPQRPFAPSGTTALWHSLNERVCHNNYNCSDGQRTPVRERIAGGGAL